MILVTGATGNVGRNVVEQLLAEGAEVRAISRNPGTAGLPAGVQVLPGDLTRPETLPAALDGVDRVFLFPAQVDALVEAAQEAGVRRIVLLSAAAVEMEAGGEIARAHLACERAVAGSGLEWTFLRPGAFMVNDLAWAESVRGTGVVRDIGGDRPSTPIDERDIAAVAVRALLDDGHASRTYLLSGPEELTAVERLRILGEVLGRGIRFEEESLAEARERMLARMPAHLVDTLLNLFTRDENDLGVSPAVAEITGKSRTYREWATHHAADFQTRES